MNLSLFSSLALATSPGMKVASCVFCNNGAAVDECIFFPVSFLRFASCGIETFVLFSVSPGERNGSTALPWRSMKIWFCVREDETKERANPSRHGEGSFEEYGQRRRGLCRVVWRGMDRKRWGYRKVSRVVGMVVDCAFRYLP